MQLSLPFMLCFFFFMSFKKKSNQVENSEEFKSFHHFFELVLLSCGYVLHGFCFGILFCSRIATCSLWFSQLLFSTLVYSWLLILLGKCLKYIAELDPINIWKAGHPWREREDWNLQSSSHPFWEGGGGRAMGRIQTPSQQGNRTKWGEGSWSLHVLFPRQVN